MNLPGKLNNNLAVKYIDLFCGIGGFRIATEAVCQEFNVKPICVFSSDVDKDAALTYQANFGELPHGDITKIAASDIPSHDLLFAGFPCQPFSICGNLEGFEDTRGTLFFDIARIIKAKQPYAFVLENVKQLQGHNQGHTLRRIISVLEDLGYYVRYKVLNALDFGLPQKRERIFIVGFIEPISFDWSFKKIPMISLSKVIENKVDTSYYASERIRRNRLAKYEGEISQHTTIWHENKSGHISSYPYSCAMRAGASYNYLLVNGERRLTEREMLRLQGFPDLFKIVSSYSAMRRLAGNSVAIPCVSFILRSIFKSVINHNLAKEVITKGYLNSFKPIQMKLFQVDTMNIETAKERLDSIIKKTRTRYYKPTQIAEVLYRARVHQDIDISNVESYRTHSKKWRDKVSKILLNASSISSSRFQDDVWNDNAMPARILAVLDRVNKEGSGIVERYIYYRFLERQGGIVAVMEKLKQAQTSPESLNISEFFELFRNKIGLKKSVDKCYEVVTYSILETVVTALETKITVQVSSDKQELLREFASLAKVLLNIDSEQMEWTELAHIYRVGVTNAADRGLDMWANFGIAIQVKHLTLNENHVRQITDQIESDSIVIVCRDADASVINTILKQISWAKRVRGIIKESELIQWYDKCLRGKFSDPLSLQLIQLLLTSFEAELPEASSYANRITNFCARRNYDKLFPTSLWQTEIDL